MYDDAWLPTDLPGYDALAEALEQRGRVGRYGRPSWLLAVGLGGRAPDGAECAALGRRLRASVRAGDLVCWLGPLGYGVLLAGAQAADAGRVAERLAPALDTTVGVARIAPGDRPVTLLDRLRTAPGEATLSPFMPPEPSLIAPSP